VQVLGGDIGGTNARLALFEVDGDAPPRLDVEHVYPSADHDGLEEIVAAFLSDVGGRPKRAAFGLAGPVRGRRVRTTNLPWVVDADAVAERFGLDQVALLNDLEATAWGVGVLEHDQIHVLQGGAGNANGNAAVIAAGTGLGEAGLYWDGARHHPFACEGGHAGFAPGNPLEIELFDSLGRRFDHVSWERLLSGPGLAAIAEFLFEREQGGPPEWLREAGDPAAAVTEAALTGRSATASTALDLFVRLYGVESGDLALKLMALGGVWVGGGIAPKILPRLVDGPFLEGFLAKGRMRPLVAAMPVRVILDDRTALLGAGRRAAFDVEPAR
jgi:glucokinase